MGLEDREYLRDEARRYGGGGGFGFRPSFSNQWALRTILIINIAVWLLQLVTLKQHPMGFQYGGITEWMSLSLTDLARFQIWRLLTYGFCHATNDLGHILWNMLFLWLYGRMIEGVYGSREFMAFYLTSVVVSGLAQCVFMGVMSQPNIGTIGASGGVMAVTILAAFHYPRATILLMFIIPIQLWVLAAFKVGMDTLGLIEFIRLGPAGSRSITAHAAHLGGAAFGYFYFAKQWRLSPLLDGLSNWTNPLTSMKRKMRDRQRQKELQVFEPNDDELRQEVDRLLEKIKDHGEASLTDEERQTLERASRVFKGR